MKVLIYGSGPIGRWLALRLHLAGKDVTLLARNQTYQTLKGAGVSLVDGFTGETHSAPVKLTQNLAPEDPYDLVVVALRKSSRQAVCPTLARNRHLKHILFMGNDVAGFKQYLECLPENKVLLGFPMAGGGWAEQELVFVDSKKPKGKRNGLFIGELDGTIKNRTREIKDFIESADLPVSLEANIDGWLKYHFAFVGPAAGLIIKNSMNLKTTASDKKGLRKYVMACREAGNVLKQVGFKKRQPPVFNIFYWIPLWLAPKVFRSLFASRWAEVALGLHAKSVGDELGDLKAEFSILQDQAGIKTPVLDEMLAYF